MIPHHQGAIGMSEELIKKAKDASIKYNPSLENEFLKLL
jgi:uncharacterized protein (DUF305 family)